MPDSASVLPYSDNGKRVSIPGLAFGCLFLVTGCTVTYTQEPQYDLTEIESPEPLPVELGIYYSPEFEQSRHVRLWGSDLHVVEIGQESVTMFDELLARAVVGSSRIDWIRPEPETGNELDGVIEPSIESFSYPLGMEANDPRHGVAYRIALYTPNGLPVASWTIEGREEAGTFGYPAKWIGDDMRAAGGEFMGLFASASAVDSSPIERKLRLIPSIQESKVQSTDDLSVTATGTVLVTSSTEGSDESAERLTLVTVRIEMEYRGAERLQVLPWTARFLTPDGQRVAQASPTTVLSMKTDPEYGYDVAGALVGPIALIPMLAQSSADAQARLDVEESLMEERLEHADLENGDSLAGVLYFSPAEPTRVFDRADVTLWFRSGPTSVFRLRIPVEDIEVVDESEDGETSEET